MSRGVNKVILVGNLGQDPETRYLPDGTAVTNVSIATSEQWKDKGTGETKERTEWHRVTFFARLAEVASEYLRKGSQIYVEGKMVTRKWEKEGQTHYTTEVRAHEMQMLGSKGGAAQGGGGGSDQGRNNQQTGGGGGARGSSNQRTGGGGGYDQDDDFGDSIPF